MESLHGQHRVPHVLAVWAVLVVVTFGFAGAKIHYLLIDALFDRLGFRFSVDDRPQAPSVEDGTILNATMRYADPSADNFIRLVVHRQPGSGS